MTYRVTLEYQDGTTTAINIIAPNKHEAEYRAAVVAERNKPVSHVVKTTRYK